MKKLLSTAAILGMMSGAVFADAHQGNRGKAAEMSDGAIGGVRDGGNVGQATKGVSGQNAEPGPSDSGWGNQDVGDPLSSVSDGKPGQSGD